MFAKVSLRQSPAPDPLRQIRIDRCSGSPDCWYAKKIGQVIALEFEDSEGYWSREGGVYNCINVVRKEDATVVVPISQNDDGHTTQPGLSTTTTAESPPTAAALPAIDEWPTHCRGCGQLFRRSCKRSLPSDWDGLPDLCVGCFIQYTRALEVFDDPLPQEADVRAQITAENDAVRAGWRFRCDRVAPRKQRYVVAVLNPSGTCVKTIGLPNGADRYSAQILGRAAIVEMSRLPVHAQRPSSL